MAPHRVDDSPELMPQLEQAQVSSKTIKKIPVVEDSPADLVQNLTQLLGRAAATDAGLIFYAPGTVAQDQAAQAPPLQLSYAQLLAEAKEKALLLGSINGISHDSIVLLHFDSQRENIAWFWACTLGGFLPAISTPFVADTAQRKKHLLHLQNLLNQPVILTTAKLAPEFLGLEELSLHTVESLVVSSSSSSDDDQVPALPVKNKDRDAPAVLMLTSGSTGNAKAVPLRHGQLLAAVKGKSEHHGTRPGDVFLNWIGLDHVASLTEIHLHAMSLGSDQVHAPAAEMLRDPLQFVRLLGAHKVAYTFAPNFFLTKVRDCLVGDDDSIQADLSRLRALISGGEANVVATCDSLTRELAAAARFGLQEEAGGRQREVIRPGFGMTETCAGSIYSRACPSRDIARNREFASLGTCIPGMAMRVVKMNGSDSGSTLLAAAGEVGRLQVSGPVVFDGYFNDPEATRAAFTDDGWFETGDLAYIDDDGDDGDDGEGGGSLNLTGRVKDTIIVNGVKWSATEIETAIEEEGVAGLVPSFTVAFPHRARNAATEDICVVYAPAYTEDDDALRFDTAAAIAKTVALICGKAPDHLVPLPAELLEKSSLGKISRTKVRAAFEKGEYAAFRDQDAAALARHRASIWQDAETKMEKAVRDTVAELLGIAPADISMRASIFELGVDSFNLISLKSMLEKAITDVDVDIPISILLTEPTIGDIATAIDTLLSQPEARVYDPIVPLQRHGTQTPLFCIHPGSGDVLVFIALAAHFPTRPIYAIRTRGYNPGERLFASIRETADTYAAHIRKTQAEGPYAIAGYSLGSTLAYEVAKVLERQGQEVRFLASIDYPPHIAPYVRGLGWSDVLLHVAFFLELIDDPDAIMRDDDSRARSNNIINTKQLRAMSRADALAYVLGISDAGRAAALAVDGAKLALISDIAENFRANVERGGYEPVGTVASLDVFVADPPAYAVTADGGRREWREDKLGRWAEFSRAEAAFWDCPGIHARMLNPQHVGEFARILKRAMKRRGI